MSRTVPRRLRHFAWDMIFEDAILVMSQVALTAAWFTVISQ
jgi:hypothetical protein